MVYLLESEIDLNINDNDPVSFSQAISCDNSEKWLDVMKEELKPMEHNEFPEGYKRTKLDSHDNLKRYKARLVAKDFIQKDDIEYKETFSLV
ncbi:hypothetical protein CR513_59886, partial [Mucuna pruriens]